MAFARPKADANGEDIWQRYTELSDVIRARNKREDRLLNVQLKFYERQKNIHLNFIRREQYQLECIRKSLHDQAEKYELKKQKFTWPLWITPRPKTQSQLFKLETPEFNITNWDLNLNTNGIQTECVSSNSIDNIPMTKDIIRCYSAR